MYYVHVLDALLSKSNPIYAHFFRVRHLLPPYSLYYYALLGLSHVVPMLVADKVIICCYFTSFVFGFRFLARSIGPSADLTSLAATLLLLNWPLGMGFVNFCLSLSFSFWAVGLWLRIVGTPRVGARVGFLLLVTGIMLTHPVPLLLLLTICATILLLRLVHALRKDSSSAAYRERLPAHWFVDLATLALAALNLGYVKVFAVANPLKQVGDVPRLPYLAGLQERVSVYAREHALSFVYGRHPDILFYRFSLLVVLVVPAMLAWRQWRRNRAAGVLTAGDAFFFMGVGIFLGLPFIPSQLNGLYYFADRLVICVWLSFLLAASGWSSGAGRDILSTRSEVGAEMTTKRYEGGQPNAFRLTSTACVVFVFLATGSLLVAANRVLRPAAKAVAEVTARATPIRGQLGFVLEDNREPAGDIKEGVSWNPYYWAGIHVFTRNDAVLSNAPWMDESIIPVAPSQALPEVYIKTLRHPFPGELVGAFRKDPAGLDEALRVDQFFLVNQAHRPQMDTVDPLLQIDGRQQNAWSCKVGISPWYRLCQKSAASPAS